MNYNTPSESNQPSIHSKSPRLPVQHRGESVLAYNARMAIFLNDMRDRAEDLDRYRHSPIKGGLDDDTRLLQLFYKLQYCCYFEYDDVHKIGRFHPIVLSERIVSAMLNDFRPFSHQRARVTINLAVKTLCLILVRPACGSSGAWYRLPDIDMRPRTLPGHKGGTTRQMPLPHVEASPRRQSSPVLPPPPPSPISLTEEGTPIGDVIVKVRGKFSENEISDAKLIELIEKTSAQNIIDQLNWLDLQNHPNYWDDKGGPCKGFIHYCEHEWAEPELAKKLRLEQEQRDAAALSRRLEEERAENEQRIKKKRYEYQQYSQSKLEEFLASMTPEAQADCENQAEVELHHLFTGRNTPRFRRQLEAVVLKRGGLLSFEDWLTLTSSS